MTRVIKAHTDTASPSAASRAAVLNLKDLAAEARQVVLDARKEAARIVADAHGKADTEKDEIVERARAEGLARGRDDGYAEGRREGLDEARTEFATTSAELTALTQEILDQLRRSREEFQESHSARVLDFALELSELIVGRIAAVDISAATANLAKVMELANRGDRVLVKANPAQLEALKAYAAEWVRAVSDSPVVELVADEDVAPGGVKAVNGQGEIDATISSQMANVVEALLGARRGATASYADHSGSYVPDGPGAEADMPHGEASTNHVSS